MLNSPYTIWEGDDVHGRRPVLTGVSVSLNRLFSRGPAARRHIIPTGLDLSSPTNGQLHGRFPGVEGNWLGVVNYSISYADSHLKPLQVFDQLVPFWALRLRQ
ncbi:hypothetical protein UK23_40510 [Lentzea aerocolonigenes]|uniref:Uncharacterized protein n=1 Tax=Lentzea aerocolonigenes TaxID=68170 RepID=A0A0F0GGX0_LENAE|nr:hypothetical protein UK23_40510 [Lentzea aerocolonigenes]